MSQLIALLDASARMDFDAVRARVRPAPSPVPIVPAPDLRAYDHLLVGAANQAERMVVHGLCPRHGGNRPQVLEDRVSGKYSACTGTDQIC
jgi:hypothetical protein